VTILQRRLADGGIERRRFLRITIIGDVESVAEPRLFDNQNDCKREEFGIPTSTDRTQEGETGGPTDRP
jgi:hypothetical protein